MGIEGWLKLKERQMKMAAFTFQIPTALLN
jgi:hypothetical protein